MKTLSDLTVTDPLLTCWPQGLLTKRAKTLSKFSVRTPSSRLDLANGPGVAKVLMLVESVKKYYTLRFFSTTQGLKKKTSLHNPLHIRHKAVPLYIPRIGCKEQQAQQFRTERRTLPIACMRNIKEYSYHTAFAFRCSTFSNSASSFWKFLQLILGILNLYLTEVIFAQRISLLAGMAITESEFTR